MANLRRVGQVIRIRVSPRDCLSILDVVQVAGVNIQGMSFAAIGSLTLSSMLESLRKQGTIPCNDGFDYAQRMASYLEGKSTADKRAITERIYLGEVKVPQGIQSNTPVDQLSVEALVDEYHRLKLMTGVKDRERLAQVQGRLDAGEQA